MEKNLTWQRKDYEVSDFRDGLILALVHSGVCVTLQDTNGDYLFIANMHAPWADSAVGEPNDSDIFGPDLGGDVVNLKNKAFDTASAQRMDIQAADGKFFEFIIDPVMSQSGQLQILTTIVDMSEERHREQVLKALLREVSHRSKNLLAIILSLASQTARGETSIDQFLKVFRGRIFSLSASQDIVTASNWTGARLSDLIRTQVNKYYVHDMSKVQFEGDDPLLSPNAGTFIGLAIHELIVNMVNHDALHEHNAQGRIECSVDGDIIQLIWVEKLADVMPNSQLEFENKFSDALLTRVVPTSVNGKATLEVAADYITYTINFVDK